MKDLEKKQTTVDGVATGDYTESGNPSHNSEGEFSGKTNNTSRKNNKYRPQKEAIMELGDYQNKEFYLNSVMEELEDEIGIYDEKTLRNYAIAVKAYTYSKLTEAITHGDPSASKYIKVLNDLISRMDLYRDDSLGKEAEQHYRGMSFDMSDDEAKQKALMFLSLKVGEALPTLNGIQSWSDSFDVADSFTAPEDEEGYLSVYLICSNNKTGVGIQHISYLPNEHEILKPSYCKHLVRSKRIQEINGKRSLFIEVQEV